MKKQKARKMEYLHRKDGDLVEVRIKDETRKTIYKNRFNARDKNAILRLLEILEKYSGYSINEIIQDRLKIGEWW